MKQTAVEWYEKQIFNLVLKLENKEISLGEYAVNRVELFDQAKTMEKEQRAEDFVEGYKERAVSSNLIFDESSELYTRHLFNEKFRIK